MSAALRLFSEDSPLVEPGEVFARTPKRAVADSNLSDGAFRLLAAIEGCTGPSRRQIWAANATLGKLCGGKEPRTVARLMRELERLGYVKRVEPQNKGGVWSVLISYQFLNRGYPLSKSTPPPMSEMTGGHDVDDRGSGRFCQGGMTAASPVQELVQEQNKNPLQSTGADSTPRGGGRGRPSLGIKTPEPSPAERVDQDDPPSARELDDLAVKARQGGPIGRIAAGILDRHRPEWRQKMSAASSAKSPPRPFEAIDSGNSSNISQTNQDQL